MDVKVCCACLCVGRRVYSITSDELVQFYLNSLHESTVKNMGLDLNIRMCKDCKGMLEKFWSFIEQARDCTKILLERTQADNSFQSINVIPSDNEDSQEISIIQTNNECNETITKYFGIKNGGGLPDPLDKDPLTDTLDSSDNEKETVTYQLKEKVKRSETGVTYNAKIIKKIGKSLERKNNLIKRVLSDISRPRRLPSPSVKKGLHENLQCIKADTNNSKEGGLPDPVGPTDTLSDKKATSLDTKSKTTVYLLRQKDKDMNLELETQDKNMEKEKTVESKPPRYMYPKATPQGYPCNDCHMILKNRRARRTHVLRYHRENVQCDHCKKTFANKDTLRIHLRLHEGPLPTKPCPFCHKTVQAAQLKYHIQRQHTKKEHPECVDCNKMFSSVYSYQEHLKFSRRHAPDPYKYICEECGARFVKESILQRHINWKHLNVNTHSCSKCNKIFKGRYELRRHEASVHDKVQAPRDKLCAHCGRGFTTRSMLRSHMRTHTGERPFKCQHCPSTFAHSGSYYTHVKRQHTLRNKGKNTGTQKTKN